MHFIILMLISFSCLGQLSLEDKVGQLLITFFNGEEVNERALRLITEARIGGFIYYKWANGLKSREHVQQLTRSLQEAAKRNHLLPLFISIDQEGGRVSHLTDGFTQFSSNISVENADQAYQIAFRIGKELHDVGINLNYAPVIDVNNNSQNPIIGDRSFGSNPNKVSEYGKKAVEGYLASGIIPTLKHFPGHGDVIIDSHVGLPIVDKSLEELNRIELIPFRKLASISPMIMTAHVLYPQLDDKNCATLSSKILKKLLREDMKYQGIIISDSLLMKSVTPELDQICEVAIKAFEAGCDLLLIGGWNLTERNNLEGNIEITIKIHHALIDAVKKGRISEKQLDESLFRILKLKSVFGVRPEFRTILGRNSGLTPKTDLI